MKIKHLISILILFIFSFTHFISAQNHIVKKGETVYAIANKYGMSIQEIYTLNPSASQGIREGENLRVASNLTKKYRRYNVKAKETLYSISRANNITVQELLDANPSITTAGLQEGQAINLPSKPIEHKVEKKETLFGISRQYGVSEQSIKDANPGLSKGLKKGMKLLIPPADASANQKKATVSYAEGFSKADTKTLRVGIFLPFTNESSAYKARFIEYYRGLLIAIQDLKIRGYSMEVYAFDIENAAKLRALLESDDIKDLHLVIGGVTDEDVATLANYTKRNNIKYVIPFPVKEHNKLGENCFVVSRPNQDLEQRAMRFYADQTDGLNVILIKDNTSNNREQFTSQLETLIKGKGGRVSSLTYSLSLEDELTSIMSNRNIIITTSSSQPTLSKLSAVLKVVKNKFPEKEVKMFGYPDWQTYGQQQTDLGELNATIYSSFFFDESSYTAKDFTAKYEKWYKTSMMRIFPKYGVLGYDTGIYFLTALARYGFDFEKKLATSDINTLQTAIQFSQSKNGGCYINDGLYIIQYSEHDVKKEKYNR